MGESIFLTNVQARRFMLLKHGLLGDYRFSGKDGVMAYIRQAGCIQFDPIDVCGKSPELVLHARVKGFTREMLYDLLYKDRTLLDYFTRTSPSSHPQTGRISGATGRPTRSAAGAGTR